MSIAVRRSLFLSDTKIAFLQSCSRCIDFCTALSPVELMELEDLCLRIHLVGTILGSIAGGTLGLSALCASSVAAINCNKVSWDEDIRRLDHLCLKGFGN